MDYDKNIQYVLAEISTYGVFGDASTTPFKLLELELNKNKSRLGMKGSLFIKSILLSVKKIFPNGANAIAKFNTDQDQKTYFCFVDIKYDLGLSYSFSRFDESDYNKFKSNSEKCLIDITGSLKNPGEDSQTLTAMLSKYKKMIPELGKFVPGFLKDKGEKSKDKGIIAKSKDLLKKLMP